MPRAPPYCCAGICSQQVLSLAKVAAQVMCEASEQVLIVWAAWSLLAFKDRLAEALVSSATDE